MTKFIQFLAVIAATLSLIAVVCIVIAELYVRWKVNQNFTFLGDGSLAALIISSFGLIFGLSYLHRR